MSTVIVPQEFLRATSINKKAPANLSGDTEILISELDARFKYETIDNEEKLCRVLKQAVSDYNATAFLKGEPLEDFDDLSTKYGEYMLAMASVK